MGAFLTIVLLFYFLVSGRQVARGIFWIVPPHRRPLVARIWTRLDPVLLRYFIGVLGGRRLRHHRRLCRARRDPRYQPRGFPGAAHRDPGNRAGDRADQRRRSLPDLVSLRTATGIINIVEYAVYATLLRLSIDQIVGPVVLGRAAHVHPVLIIFCFLAGGVVLGIPGVILAVPVALVVKSTLATLYGDDAQIANERRAAGLFSAPLAGGNPAILRSPRATFSRAGSLLPS